MLNSNNFSYINNMEILDGRNFYHRDYKDMIFRKQIYEKITTEDSIIVIVTQNSINGIEFLQEKFPLPNSNILLYEYRKFADLNLNLICASIKNNIIPENFFYHIKLLDFKTINESKIYASDENSTLPISIIDIFTAWLEKSPLTN